MCDWKNELDGGDFPTIKLGWVFFYFQTKMAESLIFSPNKLSQGLLHCLKLIKKE